MADKYFYLVASLPSFGFGRELPMTRADFLSECGKWLSKSDLNSISKTDINNLKINSKDHAVIKKWKSFDRNLREELEEARKIRKKTAEDHIPARFKELFKEQNPLLMETDIQRMRWDFLEALEFGHNFDLGILIIYFLKMQVVERLFFFDKEKGKEVFENLCEVTYE